MLEPNQLQLVINNNWPNIAKSNLFGQQDSNIFSPVPPPPNKVFKLLDGKDFLLLDSPFSLFLLLG